VVGVDQSAGELAVARASGSPGLLVRARATALPVAGGAADAVVCSMALMRLAPLDAVLGEVRRVLRPGGTFAATVPLRAASQGAVFDEILTALGQAGAGYPCDLDSSSVAARLASTGLVLEDDDHHLFTRAIGDQADAGVVVRSFYAPGAGDARVAAAVAGLERRVRLAPVRVGYRIRRLVAVARR
jgi:SAM-dependent methyltransferase